MGDDRNVLFAPRQGGKTWTMMSEIHEFVLAGRVKEVLVVHPSLVEAQRWVEQWRRRFPLMVVPEYVSVSNILKLRGRFFTKIYVENVDHYDDGIYTGRLREIAAMNLRSPISEDEEEVVYTYTPLGLNQRSHSVIASRKSVMAATHKRIMDRVVKRLTAEDQDEIERIASTARSVE